LRVGLRVADTFPTLLTENNLVARPVSEAGQIQFPAVPQGVSAPVITGIPPGLHISDIRQGARSVHDQGVITVGKDVAEAVEVVLSVDGGRIEGTVEGADRTSNTIRVSLIPEGQRRNNLLLYKRSSLVEGRFVLTDIPAGSYKLYAWEDLPAGADENVEFMATYDQRGRAVTVRAGV